MGVINNWRNAHICKLSNTDMRKAGFWDISETKWMFYKNNESLGITFFLIMNKNFPKNKKITIKLIDRETKNSYSIFNLSNSPFKNNPEVYQFLKDLYNDFCTSGFLKGVSNE